MIPANVSSGVLVFPSRMPPAARSRAAGGESAVGMYSDRPVVPPVEMIPSVSCESFNVKGTPWSGPRFSPRASSASHSAASARARSSQSCTTAFRAGLTALIRFRFAVTTSTDDACFERINSTMSVTEALSRLSIMGPSSGIFRCESPVRMARRSGRPSPGQIGGACQPPVASSITAARASATSSRHGCATIWTPIGKPSGDVPPRTTAAGRPLRLWAAV